MNARFDDQVLMREFGTPRTFKEQVKFDAAMVSATVDIEFNYLTGRAVIRDLADPYFRLPLSKDDSDELFRKYCDIFNNYDCDLDGVSVQECVRYLTKPYIEKLPASVKAVIFN